MVFPYCKLAGKVAVVNAGANRIGASTVELFREHGEKLIIVDIQDDCSQATVNKLSENVSYIRCGVSKKESYTLCITMLAS